MNIAPWARLQVPGTRSLSYRSLPESVRGNKPFPFQVPFGLGVITKGKLDDSMQPSARACLRSNLPSRANSDEPETTQWARLWMLFSFELDLNRPRCIPFSPVPCASSYVLILSETKSSKINWNCHVSCFLWGLLWVFNVAVATIKNVLLPKGKCSRQVCLWLGGGDSWWIINNWVFQFHSCCWDKTLWPKAT